MPNNDYEDFLKILYECKMIFIIEIAVCLIIFVSYLHARKIFDVFLIVIEKTFGKAMSKTCNDWYTSKTTEIKNKIYARATAILGAIFKKDTKEKILKKWYEITEEQKTETTNITLIALAVLVGFFIIPPVTVPSSS